MSNFYIFVLPKMNERGCEKKMCRAILLSEVIINRCIENKISLNTSKLQKLLYYMQKEHFKRYEKPMFNEPIVAWECGPAIKEVADFFKEGAFGFDADKKYNEKISLMDSHEDIIQWVLKEYGDISPIEIAEKSRKEESWIKIWNSGLGKGLEIPLNKEISCN